MDPPIQKPSGDTAAADAPPADEAGAASEQVPPPEDAAARRRQAQQLDREIDEELADTFPASDPLPWSHEVK